MCLVGSDRGVPWEERRGAFQLFRIREGWSDTKELELIGHGCKLEVTEGGV